MRKPKCNWWYLLPVFGFCLLALTDDTRYRNWNSHPCYAQAMIASDAVINARLGVPMEYVIRLAEEGRLADGNIIYSAALLRMLLSAYLWEESPYQYAIKIFYQCARQLHMAESSQQEHFQEALINS